jgi:hypothetical protein
MADENLLRVDGKQMQGGVSREDGKEQIEARTNSERRIVVYTVHSGRG